MRLMQHKKEAYWFYRFLSVFYDDYVNPLFWTEQMRDKALKLAGLEHPDLRVIDVGSGTGFTTQGIVRFVEPANVTCVDQSPHQMQKARRKPDLEGCQFILGDAENLPVESAAFDRYVSAGSIEYWPDPQKGIREAYRVIKPGGLALMIGPLEPGGWFSRFISNVWMLFPKEKQYFQWFENAGFEDIESVYVRPDWHTTKRSEYGIAIVGRRPTTDVEIAEERPSNAKTGKEKGGIQGAVLTPLRIIIGSIAGFFFIPIALLAYLRALILGKPAGRLSGKQVVAVILALAVIIVIVWLIAN